MDNSFGDRLKQKRSLSFGAGCASRIEVMTSRHRCRLRAGCQSAHGGRSWCWFKDNISSEGVSRAGGCRTATTKGTKWTCRGVWPCARTWLNRVSCAFGNPETKTSGFTEGMSILFPYVITQRGMKKNWWCILI